MPLRSSTPRRRWADTRLTSIGAAARRVLLTAGPTAKAAEARATAAAWRAGELTPDCTVAMPDRPARPERPELIDPARMPRRGRGGSAASRFALLHAVAHIEFNAIDLAFDMIGRFGAGRPHAFLDAWVRVGDEEAQHFALVANRLAALGGSYGDLPAHDGLWQAAAATADDFVARLAIVPLVLEARGLDVTPAMIERLARAGDIDSAEVLQRILTDEIGHVATGVRWFNFACADSGILPESAFKLALERYFVGAVKPPFNDSAREQAGLSPNLYMAVARPAG
jgi:uncharacterized ferritin-like protein (DUF455 family)